MQCLQKERKGSKCEAQNMPGEASVILSFQPYTPTYAAGTQALGVTASDLEQEEFPLTGPLWTRNHLESLIPSQLMGGKRKGERNE